MPPAQPGEDTEAIAPAVSLRPITPADQGFLLEVYGSTRAAELALLDWGDDQEAAFVSQQFDAQHRYYQQVYSQASFSVILVGGRPAGRLYVDESPEETRVIDIAILPEFRGQGLGTALLADVLAGAAARGVGVTLHVERDNRARRWYERLGFTMIGDGDVYLRLGWHPPAPAGPRAAAGPPKGEVQP